MHLEEAAQLARSLDAVIQGKSIEKVWRPSPTSLLLKIGGLGKLASPAPRLFFELSHQHHKAFLSSQWGKTPSRPDRSTLIFRQLLEGKRIKGVFLEEDRRLVLKLHGLSLVFQISGRFPQLGVLTDDGEIPIRLLKVRALIDQGARPLKSGGPAHPAFSSHEAWLMAHGKLAWENFLALEFQREQESLSRILNRAQKKRQQESQKIDATLAMGASLGELELEAALLQSVLHQIPPKAHSIRAKDWGSDPPEERDIALDPSLSPGENLNLKYRKIKRIKRQEEALLERQLFLEEEMAALKVLKERLEALNPEDEAAFEALKTEISAHAKPQNQGKPQGPKADRLPYHQFTSQSGIPILVGRSRKDNHALTFHAAKGSHIFLHVRDASGSHVILQSAKPTSEDLIDAASLAAFYSSFRGEELVEVIYCEKKHVRPVPKSPGRVMLSKSQTLLVRMEEERLQGLLKTKA